MRGRGEDPPAKKRYDRKKPVVSFRVSREQLEKLNGLIRGSGMTRGRFLRGALDLQLEKKDRIYRKGYREGFGKAKEKYTTHICCKGCGDPIPMVGGDDMEQLLCHAADEVLNVYHKDCRPPNLPEDACLLFNRPVADDRRLRRKKTSERLNALPAPPRSRPDPPSRAGQ